MQTTFPGLSNKPKNACFGRVFWKIYSVEIEVAARINSGKVKSFSVTCVCVADIVHILEASKWR